MIRETRYPCQICAGFNLYRFVSKSNVKVLTMKKPAYSSPIEIALCIRNIKRKRKQKQCFQRHLWSSLVVCDSRLRPRLVLYGDSSAPLRSMTGLYSKNMLPCVTSPGQFYSDGHAGSGPNVGCPTVESQTATAALVPHVMGGFISDFKGVTNSIRSTGRT